MSRDAALFAIAPIYFIKVPVVGGSRVVVGGKVVVPKIEKTFSFSYPTVRSGPPPPHPPPPRAPIPRNCRCS